MAEGKHVDRPLVTIITVNYNQVAVTHEMLASVQHLTYPALEVIVVDNGSPTNAFTAADAARYPNVKLLSSAKNLGFAGGNNLALREAQGAYALLINNDTELTPDLIERLLEPMEANPAIAIVCPKIRYYQPENLIQFAGYRPLNGYLGQTTPYGGKEVDQGQYDQPGPTHFAHGAAMMVRRSAWEQVGLMAEEFFLYYEELDWSCQFRRAGYQIYYQPTALVRHKESVSVGKANPLKVYYVTRNRIYFMRRNTRGLQRLLFFLFFIVLAVPKHVLTYLLKGQRAYLSAFVRGVGWNVLRPT